MTSYVTGYGASADVSPSVSAWPLGQLNVGEMHPPGRCSELALSSARLAC